MLLRVKTHHKYVLPYVLVSNRKLLGEYFI